MSATVQRARTGWNACALAHVGASTPCTPKRGCGCQLLYVVRGSTLTASFQVRIQQQQPTPSSYFDTVLILRCHAGSPLLHPRFPPKPSALHASLLNPWAKSVLPMGSGPTGCTMDMAVPRHGHHAYADADAKYPVALLRATRIHSVCWALAMCLTWVLKVLTAAHAPAIHACACPQAACLAPACSAP